MPEVWQSLTSDTTSASDSTWTYWTGDTIGTATSGNVWYQWNTGTSAGITTTARVTASPSQQTPEQIEANRLRAERQQQEYDRKRQEAAAADERAEQLLRAFLSPEQRKHLDEMSAFLVQSESERVYRIKRGRSRNIEELDENGKIVARLCAHPSELVPDPDTMLAQKIMLESNEDEFLRIANRTVV